MWAAVQEPSARGSFSQPVSTSRSPASPSPTESFPRLRGESRLSRCSQRCGSGLCGGAQSTGFHSFAEPSVFQVDCQVPEDADQVLLILIFLVCSLVQSLALAKYILNDPKKGVERLR